MGCHVQRLRDNSPKETHPGKALEDHSEQGPPRAAWAPNSQVEKPVGQEEMSPQSFLTAIPSAGSWPTAGKQGVLFLTLTAPHAYPLQEAPALGNLYLPPSRPWALLCPPGPTHTASCALLDTSPPLSDDIHLQGRLEGTMRKVLDTLPKPTPS